MYKNILVPIALDHDHDGDAAIAVAKTLQDSGGKITLLHVLEVLPGFVTAQLPKDIMDETRDQAKIELGRIAADNGIEAQVDIVYGHAGRTIVDYSNEHDINCIVVESHRPGLQDYFIGSTASFVVRHAKCPVHVMR